MLAAIMSSVKYLSVALVTWVNMVRAGSFEDYALDDDDREARTFFTSGGTYYLTLNTTYLVYAGLILAGLTLGTLALATFIAFLTKPKTTSYSTSYPYRHHPSYNYGYEPYHDSYETYDDGYHYKRRRRVQRSIDTGMKLELRDKALLFYPYLTILLKLCSFGGVITVILCRIW